MLARVGGGSYEQLSGPNYQFLVDVRDARRGGRASRSVPVKSVMYVDLTRSKNRDPFSVIDPKSQQAVFLSEIFPIFSDLHSPLPMLWKGLAMFFPFALRMGQHEI